MEPDIEAVNIAGMPQTRMARLLEENGFEITTTDALQYFATSGIELHSLVPHPRYPDA